MPTPVELKVVVAIPGPNREMVLAGIYFDFRLVEPFLGVSILLGIYLDFIALPRRNVNGAVNVVEFDPTIRRDRVGLMKLFSESAFMFGGTRCHRKQKQRTNHPQNGSCPGGKLP